MKPIPLLKELGRSADIVVQSQSTQHKELCVQGPRKITSLQDSVINEINILSSSA